MQTVKTVPSVSSQSYQIIASFVQSVQQHIYYDQATQSSVKLHWLLRGVRCLVPPKSFLETGHDPGLNQAIKVCGSSNVRSAISQIHSSFLRLTLSTASHQDYQIQ